MQSYAFPQDQFPSLQSNYHYFPDDAAATAVPYNVSYGYAPAQLPLYYNYTEPDYCWGGSGIQYQPESEPAAAPPLYAPVPVSGYTTLLVDASQDSTATSRTINTAPPFSALPSVTTPTDDAKSLLVPVEEQNPLDVYLDAPQVLFPTPSELLNDLSARDHLATRDSEPAADQTHSPDSKSPTTLGKRKRESQDKEKPENLNQRKAYFRAISDNVGFTITDPDTITSHDKKRSYLDCLEEYVQWLHEQIRLVGHEPIPLERISTYRGLKHRSLRTMLVHMQDCTQKLNLRKQQAERKFMTLQNAVLMRQAAEESLQFRRHSVAMGAIPHGVVPQTFVP